MQRLFVFACCLALFTAAASAALLTNGDFNTDSDINGQPDGWNSWSWGNGWASYKNDPGNDAWDYNGTSYVNVGSLWNGGGGWYQVLAASAGQSYSLSVFSGTEDWDNAGAYMRLLYLDANGSIVPGGENNLDTAWYDKRPWQQYTIADKLAPAGTTQVKVELAAWGGGTTMFDNATLTLVPEPSAMAALFAAVAFCRRRHVPSRPTIC